VLPDEPPALVDDELLPAVDVAVVKVVVDVLAADVLVAVVDVAVVPLLLPLDVPVPVVPLELLEVAPPLLLDDADALAELLLAPIVDDAPLELPAVPLLLEAVAEVVVVVVPELLDALLELLLAVNVPASTCGPSVGTNSPSESVVQLTPVPFAYGEVTRGANIPEPSAW
jgi:hypothetical protein